MHDDKLIAETKRDLMPKGVRYCFATYVDVHGVPKAKTCPIASFEKMARGSELFTVGAMEGMGLVGPQEDECAAVPDLASMMILPWDKRFDLVISEDNGISEVQLQGLSNPLSRPGRFSSMEPLVHTIDNWILDRTVGPVPVAQRTAAE